MNMNFNLRDWGADKWERSNRIQRVGLVLAFIAAAACLPFLGISILDTPNASYTAVLVHPVAMFVLMALGLNIVVGKSGMLDLGYVAFFALGAYAMGIAAFTAAVLGGIGNIRGAMAGGIALGLLETYAAAILGTQWKAITVFVVLILVLLFRPTGLFGEAIQTGRA